MNVTYVPLETVLEMGRKTFQLIFLELQIKIDKTYIPIHIKFGRVGLCLFPIFGIRFISRLAIATLHHVLELSKKG